jgi:O-methyltransferase/methyltransferase family protein
MNRNEWQPQDLSRLAHGYWSSTALHAAVQTGIAGALAAGPATSAELAAKLSLDPRATGMLLTALHALQIVELAGEAYALAPGLAPLLDPESPRGMGNMILHMADMVADWSRLQQCVQSGQAVEEGKSGAQQETQERSHFYRAMRDIARGQAPGLAAKLGLAAGQHLLDLGGGPGVYALTFADEVEGLQATVFDLPASEPYFREEAAKHASAGRVDFLPGNYKQDDLGGPYDVVWISQVLHGEGPGKCQIMVDKAASALKPGGVFWVQEFVLDPVNPGNPWASLFSLNMLINTEAGQSYTAEEICGFLERAGLSDAQYMGPSKEASPAGLVRAVKP